ncbi:hypothetical protein [Ralstonia insidiosa]|uniref:Cobalt transporter n=1 Tax=Ralstonia insidiosa TaxID=190721 RepID=A0A848P1T9_9RALS|nr:hypothetical protein [Ralstonia insidiosa]NMV41691.1 hypothetical protein [Ralstonia insidiosa]
MTMIRRNGLLIAGAAALAVLAVPQMASAHVSVGIGIGVPVAPVYVAPAPVYYPWLLYTSDAADDPTPAAPVLARVS